MIGAMDTLVGELGAQAACALEWSAAGEAVVLAAAGDLPDVVGQPQLRDEPIEPDEERGVEQALQPEQAVPPTSNAAEPERHQQHRGFRGRWTVRDGFTVDPR